MIIKIVLFVIACALVAFVIYGSIYFVEDDLEEDDSSNKIMPSGNEK